MTAAASLTKGKEVIAPTYKRDPAKYTILDPKTVKYKPRDAFISGMEGMLDATEVDLALALITRQTNAGASFQTEFLRLAGTYDQLRQTKARLPKFSKWVTGLYPSRKELIEEFARLGQKVTNNVFELSGDLIDILRCADTPHFVSCFAANNYQKDIPKRIAEEAAGICILFADDPQGKMKARTWGVHVKDPDGKDALLLGSRMYGVFDLKAIAQQISNKFGIDVYQTLRYTNSEKAVKLTTVNAFKENIYFDFPVWGVVDGSKISTPSM